VGLGVWQMAAEAENLVRARVVVRERIVSASKKSFAYVNYASESLGAQMLSILERTADERGVAGEDLLLTVHLKIRGNEQ
jgi:hypothetical protein